MYALKLVIQYDGSVFHGFQRLGDPQNQPTVQELFENALSEIFGHRVGIYGGGRTDRGVHALNQVISFKVKRDEIPAEGVMRQLLHKLPASVRVREWAVVDRKFHPLKGVEKKCYSYYMVFGRRLKPFNRNYVWEYPFDLDVEKMREASRIFIGRHDFGSFANGYYSPEKRLRHVFRIRIMRIPHVKSGLAIRVVGSGFLHRMVRRMVGALVDVGRGRYDIEDLKKILADRSLQSTYTIAPASGLYMARVKYITEE